MVELADTSDLGSDERTLVKVQVLLPALEAELMNLGSAFFVSARSEPPQKRTPTRSRWSLWLHECDLCANDNRGQQTRNVQRHSAAGLVCSVANAGGSLLAFSA